MKGFVQATLVDSLGGINAKFATTGRTGVAPVSYNLYELLSTHSAVN